MAENSDNRWVDELEPNREFLISAELYISTAAAAALRKPVNPRKKSEKRDASATQLEEAKRVKEKSSWLALARGSAGTGYWRTVACKLTEEGERCLFNIYLDESILYQTVYIHLLHQTDIRQADSSLFFRKECLGIYCIDGQRWTSAHTAEPIYLQFNNTDSYNTWFTLLRSYALPETYGRWFSPAEGGSYRMWRQIELVIIQGRGFGTVKPGESGADPEADALDTGVSCEIHFNDMICGRTTIKKGIGSLDWHEGFTFSDLPPFETLVILVWREKKLFKSSALGSTRIPLNNFRRGEAIEGWFPVASSLSVAGNLQVGELRLKLRVDEEIVLPYSAYSGLLRTFSSRNFLDWMSDFEVKLKLKSISSQLISVAIARNVLIEHVQELASREVDGTPFSHQTLFRGNTILTKVMELCMAWYGRAFLEASIGAVLRRLCTEKVAIEVDPLRSGKSGKDVDRNVELLIHWCQEFWNQIYSARMDCPQEIRRLFETIRTLVEKRYGNDHGPPEQTRELPWQSVSAFCFLRFIVPAILHPHLFGLCPGLPSVPVQRSLTLIAKVIQSLANLNANVQKEEFMRGVRDFLRESIPAMIDYILVVSTPSADSSASSGNMGGRHDRLTIINALRLRAATMPVLNREAIPVLPHLLDVPRHLAVITSAVIRSSRDLQKRTNPDDPSDQLLSEFCSRCLEVEEQALFRVSQLASKLSSGRRYSARILTSSSSSVYAPGSPTSRRRSRGTSRPSTAPSPRLEASFSAATSPDTDPRDFRHPFSNTTSASASRPEQIQRHRSSSTDSLPRIGPSGKAAPHRTHVLVEPLNEIPDDAGKQKRSLLRGILRKQRP